jgi:hypothetical protein
MRQTSCCVQALPFLEVHLLLEVRFFAILFEIAGLVVSTGKFVLLPLLHGPFGGDSTRVVGFCLLGRN